MEEFSQYFEEPKQKENANNQEKVYLGQNLRDRWVSQNMGFFSRGSQKYPPLTKDTLQKLFLVLILSEETTTSVTLLQI